MRTTWFAVDRDIQNHWIWENKPFAYGQAWIDLLLMARYADGKALVKGRLQDRKAGTAYVSIGFLAERWGWSKKKVRHFLKLLEDDQMVHTEGTAEGTALTIENWTIYQGQPHAEGTPKRTPEGTPEGTAEGTAEGTPEGTLNYKDTKIYKENNDLHSLKDEVARAIAPEYRTNLEEMRARIRAVNGRRKA